MAPRLTTRARRDFRSIARRDLSEAIVVINEPLTCPMCGTLIQAEATDCPYCGEVLSVDVATILQPRFRWRLIPVSFLAVAGLLMLFCGIIAILKAVGLQTIFKPIVDDLDTWGYFAAGILWLSASYFCWLRKWIILFATLMLGFLAIILTSPLPFD